MIKCIYFFIIGAFIGWLMECTFKFLTKKYERTPGILNTPFCILYGIGTLTISILANSVKNNFYVYFILSFLILTFLEYITYVLLQRIYGIILWDYTDMKLNIKGKVCITFSFVWGLLGAIYIKYILPILNKFYLFAKGKTLYYSLYILFTIILIDFACSSYVLIKKKLRYRLNNI